MQIYIIRHGETDGNAKGIFQGSTDIPLNENGVRLTRITGRAMKNIKFDECFSSPLERAAGTAELVLEASGNSGCPIVYDDRLKEISLGDWEGRKMRHGECEVSEEQVKMFFTDPFKLEDRHGGETAEDVCRRTQEFLKELVGRNDDRTYLVSTHGFACRAMLNFLYDDPDDFWQGHVPYNCAVSIVEVDNGIPVLKESDRIYYDVDSVKDNYRNLK